MFDRRFAALGWLVWQFGKRYLRKRGRRALPGVQEGGRRGSPLLLIGGLLAAAAGALWFWRRDGGDDDGPESIERP